MIDISRDNTSFVASPSEQILIDGSFSGAEARELVRAVLDATVNAQKLRNLRAHVHTEAPDTDAVRSIEDLECARENLAATLLEAHGAGLRVRLRSSLSFEIEIGDEDDRFSR